MGVIDSVAYTAECVDCGVADEASIAENGIGWIGTCWGTEAHFTKFDSAWQGGGLLEPELQSIQCKTCGGSNVKMDKKYSIF
jgi:hypothetical protein